ncbi:hypothetical protein DUNSADRAFT_14081 [Dunaliella salina]|uniref:Methyltransferase small domain-containing protein n=1 Tax=Dunaliella salina TaxID=3046 RepID=A0ABQ7G823_DUNSA|nr:hypothetical protein DUNSADRAFT_14081 [Dunaliella salina]|eukprot:KAF5830761.1 hypothetical protein DUNSADRAFT_14081 [Dunaliella salina]
MKSVAHSSTGVLRLHASLRAHSKHPSFKNVRSCSSAVETPATALPASTAGRTSMGNKKQPLRLSLGPLPLVEQRFHVGRRRYQASSSSPQQEPLHQSKYHPQEFVLLAPEDVDEVIDLYFERGHLTADPYWVRAWPSALALASTVLDYPELVRGKRVADLGAGLGVAGIAAALAGAREVVLLDREPLALQCGLASASATLRGGARVEGLQVGSPLNGRGSSGSSFEGCHGNSENRNGSTGSQRNSESRHGDMEGCQAARAGDSSTSSTSDSTDRGEEGQLLQSYQGADKATAHRRWAHLPLSAFCFHGPDLHVALPNTASLDGVDEEHVKQAGSYCSAHSSGAGGLRLCEEQRQAKQAELAVGQGAWRWSGGAGDAPTAEECDRAGSHGSIGCQSEAPNGASSGSSDYISRSVSSSSDDINSSGSSDQFSRGGGSSSSCCSSSNHFSRTGSSSSNSDSDSSSHGRRGDTAGRSSSERGPTTHVWSFPLDWSNPELVEQLAQRCTSGRSSSSSSSSSRAGDSRGTRDGGRRPGSSSVWGGGRSSKRPGGSTPPPFDVVLACDVLYEASAVQPIARVIPK